MNPNDHRDQLIDMLLREVLSGETPPDVGLRVMKSAGEQSQRPMILTQGAPARRVLVASSPQRSRLRFFAMASLLAVLAAALTAVHFHNVAKSRTPAITRVTGSADRSAGPLRAGESISTGAQSGAVLTYPDGTVVELAAGTSLRVVAQSWRERSKRIELVTGGIQAYVAPQEVGQPMVLRAGSSNAEVVGTKLSFQHDGKRTRLEVVDGEVRFTSLVDGTTRLVKSGLFAEARESGVVSGAVSTPPRRGILRFTIMNADTDKPLRTAPLAAGETISLASLPTRNINLRADYEGEAPVSVRVVVTRHNGQPTDLPATASNHQTHPPFFAAGDYWRDGRPNDCRAWTPQPGLYRISATATYARGSDSVPGKPLEMKFRITD